MLLFLVLLLTTTCSLDELSGLPRAVTSSSWNRRSILRAGFFARFCTPTLLFVCSKRRALAFSILIPYRRTAACTSALAQGFTAARLRSASSLQTQPCAFYCFRLHSTAFCAVTSALSAMANSSLRSPSAVVRSALQPCLLYTSDAADDTPCVDL
eukprot:4249160-Pleurochrysis_carterae.AAC.2